MVLNPQPGERVRFTAAYREQLRLCGHRGVCSCKGHERDYGERVGVLDRPFRPDHDFWDVRWPEGGLRFAYRLTDLERAEGASDGQQEEARS